MFDPPNNDRKIDFFVNYAKTGVYFRKNRRLFLYKMILKLNFKLAWPLMAFYWAILSYERATRRDFEVTKNSKLKNRLIDLRFFTADFRSDWFFWIWSISIRKFLKIDSTTIIWLIQETKTKNCDIRPQRHGMKLFYLHV